VKTRRNRILDAAKDLAMDLAYYDRKDDEDLPPGSIQDAIGEGDVTPLEIAEAFARALAEALS